MRSTGGCVFAANPAANALSQPIFWTPQFDPAALVLVPSPAPLDGLQITGSDLTPHTTLTSDDSRLRLILQGERFDICLAPDARRGTLAATILLDDQTPDRLTALARFWAAAIGRRVPADPRMTPQRQQRARQMLRVIDARAAGETYRVIAESLFPQHETDARGWVGSTIRETTIRLARDGLKLVRGGYRTLLCRPRRDR